MSAQTTANTERTGHLGAGTWWQGRSGLIVQAYVLAALGTVVLWRSTFRHRHLGLPTAGAGYRAGLADLLRLYPVIAAVLLLIAVVEAVEVIWIMPLLR